MISMESKWKRAAATAADAFLTAGASLMGARAETRGLPPNPRVLVVRCDHIGDAVMATTVLPAIREALRPATLDVLVASWTAALFEAHPAVDRVHVVDTPWWLAARHAKLHRQLAGWLRLPRAIYMLRSCQYDVAIDLRGDLRHILCFLALSGARERVASDRSGGRRLLTRCWHDQPQLHEVEKNAAIMALLGVGGALRLSSPRAASLPSCLSSPELAMLERGFIALAPCGNKPSRDWPIARAAELARLVSERLFLGVVFVGGPDQSAAGEVVRAAAPRSVVNLAGRSTLLESCGALARARVAVAVDSGPMHLAAMMQAPVLALFGAGDEQRFRPWTDRSRIVRTPAVCSCRGTSCDRTGDGVAACMSDLAAEQVFDALCEMLEEFPAATNDTRDAAGDRGRTSAGLRQAEAGMPCA
jgi:ADP-heptose:LPS heptosyltransferase